MAGAANRPEDPDARELLEYLQRRVDDGEQYFKSRYIADDLDHSPNEIGALFVKLADTDVDLEIYCRT